MKYLILFFFVFFSIKLIAQPNYSKGIQMEKLNSGLVAFRSNANEVVVTWRYLPTDAIDATFDVYRAKGKSKFVKINDNPIINSTFYIDNHQDAKNDYTYSIRYSGQKENISTYTLKSSEAQKPYLEIDLPQIEGDNGWNYSPNDASVGDLDGDGEYEIVIKREARSHDNAHSGLTDPLYIEAYKLNGKRLWQMNLGPNIRSGAHYTQFMVYDFDGDGRAEIALRTAEETIFGDGTKIGDTNGDGRTNYLQSDPKKSNYGFILEGPEFLSIIEGTTGKELARTNYISRGEPFSYGDNQGNRVDRFLSGVGYFDGLRPSILICRGYYERTTLEAWDYRNGKLSKRWRFDTHENNYEWSDYEGQGNHNLSIADVDGDGCDEITYGACLIDHDGTPKYNTRLGHGDAIHLTDINLDNPGLEVWDCHESAPSPAGGELRDAATGKLLWGVPAIEDVGRALAADVDPRFRGCEVWSLADHNIYTADGRMISERQPSVNFAIWWDGDLNRELFNGSFHGREMGPRTQDYFKQKSDSLSAIFKKKYPEISERALLDSIRQALMRTIRPNNNVKHFNYEAVANITKWNGDGVDNINVAGMNETQTINGTKSNPCLQADILGDWREELILPTSDHKHLRIFITSFPTNYRFYPLMCDPVYRIGIAIQNVAYNQPPHTSFYLGSDLGKFTKTRLYSRDTSRSKSGEAKNGRPNGMHQRYIISNVIDIDTIYCNKNFIKLDALCDYETTEWYIDGVKYAEGRFCTILKNDENKNKYINVKIVAQRHGARFEGKYTITFLPRRHVAWY